MLLARVRISAIETEFCDWMGEQRYRVRRARGSIHTNNRRVSEQRAIAEDQLGVRCECAAKSYLPMTRWHNEIADRPGDIPDLECGHLKIDVKGVPRHGFKLLCPVGHVRPGWIYLLVSAQEHPWYVLAGWCDGLIVKYANISEPQQGRPCHTVEWESKLLHDPAKLRAQTEQLYTEFARATAASTSNK